VEHRFTIGIVGDAGVRGCAQQPRLYVGMILILIFGEVSRVLALTIEIVMKADHVTGVRTLWNDCSPLDAHTNHHWGQCLPMRA
jgi:hypothetical protein